MNPLLYAIYQFLKLLVRLSLRIFYPSKKYIHPERLQFDYPAIVVSNHPNTLLDPLTAAAKTKKLVYFLANAGLFKSAFGHWFFNTFYCIPVQRPQDASGKKKVSNEDSFARANDHLTGGGVLYIAPEGTSEMERRLRPLKTGTARIALSTEKKNNYQLGMAIVPVGLTYYRPDTCGSRQIVHVGEPIFPQQYAEDYEADSIQTVRKLTADLENRMRGLLIDTADDTEDQRLRLLESIQQNNKPLAGEERFHREMTILQKMRQVDDPIFFEQVDQYRELLQKNEIKDGVVAHEHRYGKLSLLTIMLLPIYAFARINHYLPTHIPIWIDRKLGLYKGYSATVKILAGLIFIPLLYFIQTKIVSALGGGSWWWPYFISLPLSAWVVWKMSGRLRKWRVRRRYRQLGNEQQETLKGLRKALLMSHSEILKSKGS